MRLWDEAEGLNKGNGNGTLLAVFEQLPFFCSYNNILDEGSQFDIEKYLYCKETSTPAYKGAYDDTPSIWIRKYYVIKRAMLSREIYFKNKMDFEKNGSK